MASIVPSDAGEPWRVAMEPPMGHGSSGTPNAGEEHLNQVREVAAQIAMLTATLGGGGPNFGSGGGGSGGAGVPAPRMGYEASCPASYAWPPPMQPPAHSGTELVSSALQALALQVRAAGVTAAAAAAATAQQAPPPCHGDSVAAPQGAAARGQPRAASGMQQPDRAAAIVLDALARAGLASQVRELAPPPQPLTDPFMLAAALNAVRQTRPPSAGLPDGMSAMYAGNDAPREMRRYYEDPLANDLSRGLPQVPQVPQMPHVPQVPQTQPPSYGTQQPGGEWVKAVMEVMPYLNSQQLREALHILDRAIANSQKAKALERIAYGSQAVPGDSQSMPRVAGAAELMRQQVLEEQRQLIAQLHSLSQAAGVPAAVGFGFQGHDMGVAQPPIVPMQAHVSAGGVSAVAARGGAGFVGGYTSPAHEKVQAMTLSMSLQLLSKEDPDTLFIVRRINKLGFKAARKIRQHFSQYGHVVRVLVAHSTVRQTGDPVCQWRRRPSSLGFVHMAQAAAVRRVLLGGEEHEVDGCLIRVQQFERQNQTMNAIEEEEAADEDQKPMDPERDAWERQQSALSGVSTATGSGASSQSSGEAEKAPPSHRRSRAAPAPSLPAPAPVAGGAIPPVALAVAEWQDKVAAGAPRASASDNAAGVAAAMPGVGIAEAERVCL